MSPSLSGFFQILWFSAMFPYVVLTVLCAKALTLDGAIDGLKFLFTPDWSRLAMSECWIDGGTQVNSALQKIDAKTSRIT
jgi:SNF family Na+-dependent transporter